MATLELHNVTKRFGSVTALNHVSFSADEGGFFVLLGAPGAGKSTTINVITGIEKLDEGQITLGGRDITQELTQTRDIATAFENYALYPHMTVFHNLLFPLEAPLRAREMQKSEREKRVKEIAEMLSISELLQRYPRQLSGGQKQRVALGRTLIRKPKLYLLDEPIAHLDAKLRHRMRSELKKIQKEFGITALYATPDQLEALSMADTIGVLNKGVLEQVGKPDDIYFRPNNIYVAAFISDPPMNFIPAKLRDNALELLLDDPVRISLNAAELKALKETAADQALKVGIRPVDFAFVSPSDPRAQLRGEVALLDSLGQISIVTVRIGKNTMTAKVSSDNLPERGHAVGLSFDRERIYIFDAATGKRISGGESAAVPGDKG
jgi:multiple sugar transport system ATP-binding protein